MVYSRVHTEKHAHVLYCLRPAYAVCMSDEGFGEPIQSNVFGKVWNIFKYVRTYILQLESVSTEVKPFYSGFSKMYLSSNAWDLLD